MQYLEKVTWRQYVRTIATGDTNVEISRKTGIGQSTISRWGTPRIQDAVAFARGYNQPVLEALIAAGFITAADAHADITISIQKRENLTNPEILDLLAQRLNIHTQDDYDPAAGTLQRPEDTWAE